MSYLKSFWKKIILLFKRRVQFGKIKVAHIYVSRVKTNSGDYLLGIATKAYFQQKFLDGKKCYFENFDCRNPKLFLSESIDVLNQFDFILVGGGGLILPDSASNTTSGWQWNIDERMYQRINRPIYAIAIGYNLFFEQDITMPERDNSTVEIFRKSLFDSNINALIERATHFTLRHRRDVEQLKKHLYNRNRERIGFEFCPTIWYVQKCWKDDWFEQESSNGSIAIEIKDDREWRRYYKIGKDKYFAELTFFVKFCLSINLPVKYLSHDGSRNYYDYLFQQGIELEYLDNSVADEDSIRRNYSKIGLLFCSAGHSQMIAYGLGIKTVSLVTHPKLKNFCDDIGSKDLIDVNAEDDISNTMISYVQKKFPQAARY